MGLIPRILLRYAAASLAGGLARGGLLLLTPAAAFARAILHLMLLATLMFLIAPSLITAMCRGSDAAGPSDGNPERIHTIIQFAASLMVGYFNAGSGIIVMAGLSLCRMREAQLLNGFNNLLGAVAAGASIAALAVGGRIAWTSAGLMMAGSLIGGLSGVRIAQRIDAQLLRVLILAFSFLMTGYFFWKFWL